MRTVEIPLVNWEGKATKTVKVDMDNVKKIWIDVIYGDEHLNIVYKDGTKETISSDHAIISGGYDGSYIVYDDAIDLTLNEEWLNCRDSYYRMEIGNEVMWA